MTENPKNKINNILFDRQTVNSSERDERVRARNVCKGRVECVGRAMKVGPALGPQ